MTYKGESPAKKIARLELWKDISKLLGGKFASGILLSLLSPEAGDVSVQLGMGAQPDNIIGVDIDKHAASAAQYKFKDVNCLNADVVDAARKYKGKIVAAHLDFCACMTDDLLEKVASVESCLATGGCISCAFMVGREKGELRDEIINAANPSCSNVQFGARATVLAHEIASRARTRRVVRPLQFSYYKSDTPGKNGVHMITYLGIRGATSANTIAKRRKKVNDMLRRASYKTVNVDYKRLASKGVTLEKMLGMSTTMLLLNVRRQTIAAWKAHFTMGTY